MLLSLAPFNFSKIVLDRNVTIVIQAYYQASPQWLMVAYFGICSHLLYNLFIAFIFFICAQVFYLSLSSDFEFSLSCIVQNNRDQTCKIAGTSVINNQHVFNHVNTRVCDFHFGPALYIKTWSWGCSTMQLKRHMVSQKIRPLFLCKIIEIECGFVLEQPS